MQHKLHMATPSITTGHHTHPHRRCRCATFSLCFLIQALLGYCLDLEYVPVSSMGAADGLVGDFVELLRQTLAGAVAAAGGGVAGLQ